jgi:L-fuconolactonase
MIVDTHQHFWNLEKVAYPWLVPAYGPIYRTFEAPELAPQIKAAGIDMTVLVQSMDSYEDTEYMLETAAQFKWIRGVVGWVPLLRPEEAAKKLEIYSKNPVFKGMRHLIHTEEDPDWVVQDVVIEGLRVLASFNMTFDVVAVFPNHLKHVPTLTTKVPNLKIVIDHLAKPPYSDAAAMKVWREQFAAAAESPNVYAKISGLNTATGKPDSWTAADIAPAIDFALETFGADRLMFGSDWPVAILAGDYAKVWAETNKAIARLSASERSAILGGTAAKFYRL